MSSRSRWGEGSATGGASIACTASRWRKMNGVGKIRLSDGWVVLAELHWYEAHGIGRRELKAKRYLE